MITASENIFFKCLEPNKDHVYYVCPVHVLSWFHCKTDTGNAKFQTDPVNRNVLDFH